MWKKGEGGKWEEGKGSEGRNGKERRRRRKGPERDTELGARSSHGTADADSERNSETMPCLLILLLWRFRRDNKRTVGKQVRGAGVGRRIVGARRGSVVGSGRG